MSNVLNIFCNTEDSLGYLLLRQKLLSTYSITLHQIFRAHYCLYLFSFLLINIILRLCHNLCSNLLMAFGQNFHFFKVFLGSNELVLFIDLLCQTWYLYFVIQFTLVAKRI